MSECGRTAAGEDIGAWKNKVRDQDSDIERCCFTIAVMQHKGKRVGGFWQWDGKWCAGNKQNKRLVPHKGWHWPKCWQKRCYSSLGYACACALFYFIFFIHRTGVDILESSHACYCFSTTPRLPGTSSSTSFVLTPQLLFPFTSSLFLLQKCKRTTSRATSCFILCGLTKWISLISRERWLALFFF